MITLEEAAQIAKARNEATKTAGGRNTRGATDDLLSVDSVRAECRLQEILGLPCQHPIFYTLDEITGSIDAESNGLRYDAKVMQRHNANSGSRFCGTYAKRSALPDDINVVFHPVTLEPWGWMYEWEIRAQPKFGLPGRENPFAHVNCLHSMDTLPR